jgi:hypothetical protein
VVPFLLLGLTACNTTGTATSPATEIAPAEQATVAEQATLLPADSETAEPTPETALPTAVTEATAALEETPAEMPTVSATEVATSTPVADTGANVSTTNLTGPAITMGGVSFTVDTALIPNVQASSGPIYTDEMDIATPTTMSVAGDAKNLTGRVFVLPGLHETSDGQPIFDARIIVVPVSAYESMAPSMMPSATTDNTMPMTDTMATVTPMVTGSATMEMTGLAFVQTLSDTLSLADTLKSSAISDSLMLASPMTLIPRLGARPLLQTNPKRVDFQNGQGVRFVTAYGDGLNEVTNDRLYYVFNGLTNDRQFHVSAALPLTSTLLTPEHVGAMSSADLTLPANPDSATFDKYLGQVVTELDNAANTDPSFTSRLNEYDKLIESLLVDAANMQ